MKKLCAFILMASGFASSSFAANTTDVYTGKGGGGEVSYRLCSGSVCDEADVQVSESGLHEGGNVVGGSFSSNFLYINIYHFDWSSGNGYYLWGSVDSSTNSSNSIVIKRASTYGQPQSISISATIPGAGLTYCPVTSWIWQGCTNPTGGASVSGTLGGIVTRAELNNDHYEHLVTQTGGLVKQSIHSDGDYGPLTSGGVSISVDQLGGALPLPATPSSGWVGVSKSHVTNVAHP